MRIKSEVKVEAMLLLLFQHIDQDMRGVRWVVGASGFFFPGHSLTTHVQAAFGRRDDLNRGAVGVGEREIPVPLKDAEHLHFTSERPNSPNAHKCAQDARAPHSSKFCCRKGEGGVMVMVAKQLTQLGEQLWGR